MTTQWHRFETRWQGSREPEDALAVCPLVRFQHESGAEREVGAFWDGGRTWEVRFRPDLPGRWTYRSECAEDAALEGQDGVFECGTAETETSNPLYRYGALRVAPSGTYFEHADGTPFLWLGDTAWNGPLKSSAADWEEYLKDRAAKRFSVIQFVGSQWLAAAGDAEGRRAYNGGERIQIDPVYFRRLDARMDAINRHGMAAAPVIAWAAHWNKNALDLNPGTSLSHDQLVRLGRYFVARYGAHHVFWILAGDGEYRGAAAQRWKKIGREIFPDGQQLATMHPGGLSWVADEFADEPWFRFNGYQSAHWRAKSMHWITQGEPSYPRRKDAAMPHVDLEICYEAHEDFDLKLPFSAADVRRAAWSTLLTGSPAGFTYGAHGVWSWEEQRNPPMNHPRTGLALPWREAMGLP
ncbi:MAG: DUF4038 domain-containing protein, partial [Acidobacteriia bacterium]|nr:DUF4038 domain-containing protein [Terriglobia bacterium]